MGSCPSPSSLNGWGLAWAGAGGGPKERKRASASSFNVEGPPNWNRWEPRGEKESGDVGAASPHSLSMVGSSQVEVGGTSGRKPWGGDGGESGLAGFPGADGKEKGETELWEEMEEFGEKTFTEMDKQPSRQGERETQIKKGTMRADGRVGRRGQIGMWPLGKGYGTGHDTRALGPLPGSSKGV